MLEATSNPQTIHYPPALPPVTKPRVILNISGTPCFTFPSKYYVTDLRVIEEAVLSLETLDLSGLHELRSLRLATPRLRTVNYPSGLVCLKVWESGIYHVPSEVLQGLVELWVGENQLCILQESGEELGDLRRLVIVCEHRDEDELSASTAIENIYLRCPNVVIRYEQYDQV